MHAAFFRQLTSQLLDCKRSFVGKPQGMSPFPARSVALLNEESPLSAQLQNRFQVLQHLVRHLTEL
jgi:hypothetical protein